MKRRSSPGLICSRCTRRLSETELCEQGELVIVQGTADDLSLVVEPPYFAHRQIHAPAGARQRAKRAVVCAARMELRDHNITGIDIGSFRDLRIGKRGYPAVEKLPESPAPVKGQTTRVIAIRAFLREAIEQCIKVAPVEIVMS